MGLCVIVCVSIPAQMIDGVVVSDMRTAAASACAIKVSKWVGE